MWGGVMTEGNLPPQRRRGAEKTLSFLRGRCGVCIWGCAVIGVCLYKDAEAAETLARWRVAEDVMENPLRIFNASASVRGKAGFKFVYVR
jgi:hypothetical protein